MARGRCGSSRCNRGSERYRAGAFARGGAVDGALQPWLMLAFLATTPLYAGLMYFSLKVLRPLFAEVEESQGKYSSHQIDAIKGIEAVKAASAENVFATRC
jgi:ABC-type bacteriocin/lantibiotic exporter with double-glycine peptidase domain